MSKLLKDKKEFLKRGKINKKGDYEIETNRNARKEKRFIEMKNKKKNTSTK